MRVDYTPTSSGWSTPRGAVNGIHDVIVESDGEDILSAGLKSREQAKRLEYKVARVAGKKCSVEEVSSLHKELQDWLTSSAKTKPREQVCNPVMTQWGGVADGDDSYRFPLWNSVLRFCVPSS